MPFPKKCETKQVGRPKLNEVVEKTADVQMLRAIGVMWARQ